MEIREVRAFAAVAEEGSLSAAARRLHLSQSALSQTIQSLERQLGVQLLLRSRTGVVTTEAGATLLREGRALIAQYEQTLAAVAASGGAGPGNLKVGIPLELPAGLLPGVLAELSADFPLTRAEVSHASSASQFAELEAGRLDLALVREYPVDPRFDAVLAVEESLGVVLTVTRADELADPTGIRLHRLAGLDWAGFPRSEAPVWYDQVAATLRAHGVSVEPRHPTVDGGLIAEVKFAAVGTGRAFALAPPEWSQPLPPGVTWRPLIGNPIVRRTWAAWAASSRRRDLAVLVAALDLTTRGQE
jgi:molybdate transport repressor ModE-like protein